MSFYQKVSKSSDAHNAKELKGGGLRISATDSGDQESLERFQPVALEALEHQHEGYEIVQQHKSSIYSGNLYDCLVLKLMD